MSDSSFPADFLWGAATSAYQIEGSPLADGAGASIWHRFAHTPGNIFADQNGDLACDHYRRFVDDVRLMRELAIRAYRFSISWSRLFPNGTGNINRAGLDFYSRLVDTLLEHHIQPMATLYHWDLPQALEDRGGWAHANSADWFAEYAALAFRSLDDRVKLWATLNEPWVVVDHGYIEGRHAPGRSDWAEAALVSKNLLRAHAAAVRTYRNIGKHSIGLVVNLIPVHPATESLADRQAANRVDAYVNRQFLDPVLQGVVPSELAEIFGAAWPAWTSDELRAVAEPIDFVGVNYYLRWVVCDDPPTGPARARLVVEPNAPQTATGWEIYPHGLLEILQWLNNRYGSLPLYITENGAAFDDVLLPNGRVDDFARVKYLNQHLEVAKRAIDAGVDLRGYFLWSLLDNFEWQSGYSKRFGIVYVDFKTQQRFPKASARFYSNVIRTNGAALKVE
ncbi:MAG TPA: GH1 family beta-glucosidase [Lacipirellulaceae bacterium]|nr:GH1 family beta-glucosidase [Lacipirellulaceae bacterium]